MGSCWQCPVCSLALEEKGTGFTCTNGHSFDRARQGYVNLLLANQKHSKEPGDSADMLEARRRFLAAGHYQTLMQKICERIARHKLSEEFHLLDVGCGEGSYLDALSEAFPKAHFWGNDISKVAVKRAAAKLKHVEFSVASNVNLPVQSGSMDVVVSVFSPFNGGEVKRVLSGGGFFIRVLPGPKHLWELKSLIYQQPQLHKKTEPIEDFDLLEALPVNENMLLEKSAFNDLLAMTPLNWRGDTSLKEKLANIDSLSVQSDFVLEVWQPTVEGDE